MIRYYLFAFLLLNLTITASKAEMNLDVIYGEMTTNSSSVTATTQGFFNPSTSETRDIDYGINHFIAVRTTYWSDLDPSFGTSLEVSMAKVSSLSNAGSSDVEISMLSITGQILFRESLFVADKYPHGRLQLYLGAGLYMVLGNAYVDFTPTLPTTAESEGTTLGTGIIVGSKWMISKEISLFIEHRTTNININYDDGGFLSFDEVDTDLSSSYLLLGMGWEM